MAIIFDVDPVTHKVTCHGEGWVAKQDKNDPAYAEVVYLTENAQFNANGWTFTSVVDPDAGLALLPHATVLEQ